MAFQNLAVTRKKYKVRDRVTGKEYTLDWDKPEPPTEVDVEQELNKAKRTEAGLKEPPAISSPTSSYKEPSFLSKVAEKAFVPLTDFAQKTGRKVSDYIQDSPKLKLAAEIHDRIRNYPPGTTMTMPEAIGLGADAFTSPASIATMGLGTANTILPIAAKNALSAAQTPKQIASANRLAKVAQGTYLANQGVNLGFGGKGAYDLFANEAGSPEAIAGGAQALIGLGGFGLGMRNARNIPKTRPMPDDIIPEVPAIGTGGSKGPLSPFTQKTTKYGSTKLQFDDEIDKALYIISNPRADAKKATTALTWLTNQTKLTPGQIRTVASDIRKEVKKIRDNSADETVIIPKLFSASIQSKPVQEPPIVQTPYRKTPDEVLRESEEQPIKPQIKLEKGAQEITLTNPNGSTVKALVDKGYTFVSFNPDKTMRFKLTNKPEPVKPIQEMNEQGVIGVPPKIEDVQFARTNTGVKIGADVESLGKVLGSSLYKGPISKIVAKELMQNSLDAVRHLGSKGKVDITVNRKDRFVEVSDNGRGLTRQELETVFTDLGSSGKRDDTSAIGGFGLAKAAPLLGGERVEVSTIVHEKGLTWKYSFAGTPDELLKGVNVTSEVLPPGTPTGTKVRTYVPDGTSFYEADEFINAIGKNSPGIQGKISKRSVHSWESSNEGQVEEFSPINLSQADIKNISGPAADVEIIVPKGTKYGPSHGVEYQILNNGMFQARGKTGGWTELPGIPDRILVNIKSKVPEGHVDYPFVANRESLRGTTQDLIDKYIDENIIKPSVGKRVDELKRAYHGMPEFNLGYSRPERPFHIFDPKGLLEQRDYDRFSVNPKLKSLSRTIVDVTNHVMSIVSDKAGQAKLKKLGLIFADDTKGLHLPSPGEDSSAILINPFGIMLSKNNNPEQAATGLLHTILHEIAHIPGGGHDEEFAVRLSQVYEAYGARNEVTALDKFLIEIADSELPNEYNPEIQELLRRYQEIIGRTATKEDVLSGTGITSRIKTEGQRTNVPDTRSDGERTLAKPNDAGELGPFDKSKRKATPKRYNKTKATNLGNKIADALVDMKELRVEQDLSDSVERARRFAIGEAAFKKAGGGLRGAIADLAAMKGPLPIIEYDGEFALSQADVDEAVNAIWDKEVGLLSGQRKHAYKGLMRLIGHGDGRPVSNNELRLLTKVFGGRFGETVKKLNDEGFIANPLHKMTGKAVEWINLPKSLLASGPGDVSFLFRQGLLLLFRKEFKQTAIDLLKAKWSEAYYQNFMQNLEDNPLVEIADEAGIDLPGFNTRAEELHLGSQLAEQIPIIGRSYIRSSSRSFDAGAISLRLSAFAAFDEEFREFMKIRLGRSLTDIELDESRKKIAKLVNTLTGRGSLGQLEPIGDILNIGLFSPRLWARNLKMANPYTYIKPEVMKKWNDRKRKPNDPVDIGVEKFIRMKYLRGLGSALVFALSVVGLAKVAASMLGLEEVGTTFDTRNPDFMKLRIGNIRLDFLGGLQQSFVEASQLAHYSKVSSVSGRETEFGSKYGTDDAMEDLYKFVESKASPTASMTFIEYLRNKDQTGKKLEFWNYMYRHSFPLVVQDLKELYDENPLAVMLIIPAMFGVGVQVQQPFGYNSRSNLANVKPIRTDKPMVVPAIR